MYELSFTARAAVRPPIRATCFSSADAIMADDKSTLVGVCSVRQVAADDDSDFLIGFRRRNALKAMPKKVARVRPDVPVLVSGSRIDHGRQFAFDIFTVEDPHSRTGIIVYSGSKRRTSARSRPGTLRPLCRAKPYGSGLTPDIAAPAVNKRREVQKRRSAT